MPKPPLPNFGGIIRDRIMLRLSRSDSAMYSRGVNRWILPLTRLIQPIPVAGHADDLKPIRCHRFGIRPKRFFVGQYPN